jgi:dTDP-glucose pyrophosphorylase
MSPITDTYCLSCDANILEALKKIDASSVAMVVVHEQGAVKGVLNDGDLRRALIAGAPLTASIYPYFTRDYVSVQSGTSRADVLDLMQARSIEQIPIIGEGGGLLGIHTMHSILGGKRKPNWAVIMAGGKGTRLRPLTENLPKPMIKVAGRPILERLILHLVGLGVKRIFISVNYMGHIIEDYFKDGSEYGCSIEYLREEEPLGTGGSLSLLPEVPEEPILVMNGDLVMQANLDGMLRFHGEGRFQLTMGVKPYRHEIPFGCVESESGRILSIVEKPSIDHLINAGVYVLSPDVIKTIPKRFFPITDLFKTALTDRLSCGSYLIEDEWADVGQMDDLKQAQGKH